MTTHAAKVFHFKYGILPEAPCSLWKSSSTWRFDGRAACGSTLLRFAAVACPPPVPGRARLPALLSGAAAAPVPPLLLVPPAAPPAASPGPLFPSLLLSCSVTPIP